MEAPEDFLFNDSLNVDDETEDLSVEDSEVEEDWDQFLRGQKSEHEESENVSEKESDSESDWEEDDGVDAEDDF